MCVNYLSVYASVCMLSCLKLPLKGHFELYFQSIINSSHGIKAYFTYETVKKDTDRYTERGGWLATLSEFEQQANTGGFLSSLHTQQGFPYFPATSVPHPLVPSGTRLS